MEREARAHVLAGRVPGGKRSGVNGGDACGGTVAVMNEACGAS
jgi:hypothetical protein